MFAILKQKTCLTKTIMPIEKTTTLKPIFNTEMKHLSKLSDEELVVLYSEGNNKAFDILLTRYKNRIYSYIFLYR